MSFALSFSTYAQDNQDVFKYDEQQVKTEFQQLNKLEEYVNTHEGITLDEVEAKTNLSQSANLETTTTVSAEAHRLPGGIPAFVWGCLFSAVGILLVFVISNGDDKLTRQAFIGCAVTGAIVGVGYLITFILSLAATSY